MVSLDKEGPIIDLKIPWCFVYRPPRRYPTQKPGKLHVLTHAGFIGFWGSEVEVLKDQGSGLGV